MKTYAINWMFMDGLDEFVLHTNHIEAKSDKEALASFRNIFNIHEWIHIKICAIGKNIK